MNEYIDMDAHIDIHSLKDNSVEMIYPYSLSDPEITGVERK